MTTGQLTIHSRGCCFFCSTRVVPTKPFHDSGKLSVRSIQDLSEHLELDIGSVLSNGKDSIPPPIPILEVELCVYCVELYERLLKSLGLGQSEENEAELKYCLSRIQENLFIAGERDTTDEGDDKILGDLRWETLQKCSQKLNMGIAKVKLQKLTELESHNSIAHHFTSSAPDKNLSEGGNEEDLDDDKIKHSSSKDDHAPLSDGEMVDRSEDDDELPPDNDVFRSSTRQTESKRTKINPNGNQTGTGGASKLKRNGKYPKPIIIYGSKSGRHTQKSFKKSSFNSKTGKYKCSRCPKEYNWAHHARRHFDIVHLDIRYKCPDRKCRSSFSCQDSYRWHVGTVHLDIRIECPICKEKIRKGMLFWHRRRNAESGSCQSLRVK